MHTKTALFIGFVTLAVSASSTMPIAAYAATASSSASAIAIPFNGLNPGPAVCVGGMTTNIISGQPCDATSSPITGYNPGGPIIISPAHPILPLSLTTPVMGVGTTGISVQILQTFLNQQGFIVAASGAGSSGNESEYFGSATRAALAKFQASVGITPASGYFGTITRAYVAHEVATGTGSGTQVGTTTTTYQGSITCLPHQGEVSTMECAFGLATPTGLFYALDLSAVPNANLETDVEMTVAGTLEASSTQNAALMQEYKIQGVIQVQSITPTTVTAP